jgi:hypothetical protein
MDSLSLRSSRRNSSDSRHYCRNQHCRSRLKEPIDHPRSAFCTRGCYKSFYRSRCLVCERSIIADPSTGQPRQRLDQRKFCGRRCKHEARRYPHLYADPFLPYGNGTDNSKTRIKRAPKRASKQVEHLVQACRLTSSAGIVGRAPSRLSRNCWLRS